MMRETALVEEGEMRRSYQFVLALLGVLLAAPSIISVLQREFSFGLAPAFENFVAFYRALVEPMTGAVANLLRPLLELWDVSLPVWLGDAQVLSLVSAGILSRAVDLDINADSRGPASSRGLVSYLRDACFFLFLGLSLLALPMLALFMVAPITTPLHMWVRSLKPQERRVESYEALRTEIARATVRLSVLVVQTTLATVAAVLAFYLGNLLSQ